MTRLMFWWAVARPSYWLYLAGLPNGYGYVSGRFAHMLMKNRHSRARLPHEQRIGNRRA